MRGTRAKGILGLPYHKVSTVDPELVPVNIDSIITRCKGPCYDEGLRREHEAVERCNCGIPRVFAREKGIDSSCPSSLLSFALRRIHEGRSLSSLKTLHSAFL
ncbi:hypothetical protein PRIPAC_71146 [Pristionchus pacificus]|uniref:Uncharacterized protein n=1 Tax=Pristionchus pacificus TaxID=54126 RepID=A0A2A6CS64_PRIPA|nr:hypothetical protein PRIPAC_71146 [Pristionchus pacificus]|eukprot:PDM81054.1 hypothetical protein PRIPAC_36057 [Pristionchus pacificus]